MGIDRDPALGEPTPADKATDTRGWWLLAAAAFVVGLVLGGVVGTVAFDDGDADDVAVSSAPSTTSSTMPARRLPESCFVALDEARYVLELVDRGVSAISNLEAAQLDEVLDEVELHRPLLSDAVAECREDAGL